MPEKDSCRLAFQSFVDSVRYLGEPASFLAGMFLYTFSNKFSPFS